MTERCKASWLVVLAVALAVGASGCSALNDFGRYMFGDDPDAGPPDGGEPRDGGVDAGRDAGGETDAGRDAGPPGDAGVDGGPSARRASYRPRAAR
ncbi:MAG: hypothetical protein M5U28_00735 [Sandaracinaceae bacterium]|nr:hypothetical protein [Sandaracinaceae bacterium]